MLINEKINKLKAALYNLEKTYKTYNELLNSSVSHKSARAQISDVLQALEKEEGASHEDYLYNGTE